METVIAALIGTVPNLAIAVWVIFSYQKTITTLLQNQQKLIDKLLVVAGMPIVPPGAGD